MEKKRFKINILILFIKRSSFTIFLGMLQPFGGFQDEGYFWIRNVKLFWGDDIKGFIQAL